MSERIIEQPGSHKLYRWTQDGEEWACCAYDHGPMCRRCVKVEDETLQAMLNNVEDGRMIVRDFDREGMKFKLTAKGQAQVENLVSSDAGMAALYGEAQKKAREEGAEK